MLNLKKHLGGLKSIHFQGGGVETKIGLVTAFSLYLEALAVNDCHAESKSQSLLNVFDLRLSLTSSANEQQMQSNSSTASDIACTSADSELRATLGNLLEARDKILHSTRSPCKIVGSAAATTYPSWLC